jgi:hypothetical protein
MSRLTDIAAAWVPSSVADGESTADPSWLGGFSVQFQAQTAVDHDDGGALALPGDTWSSSFLSVRFGGDDMFVGLSPHPEHGWVLKGAPTPSFAFMMTPPGFTLSGPSSPEPISPPVVSKGDDSTVFKGVWPRMEPAVNPVVLERVRSPDSAGSTIGFGVPFYIRVPMDARDSNTSYGYLSFHPNSGGLLALMPDDTLAVPFRALPDFPLTVTGALPWGNETVPDAASMARVLKDKAPERVTIVPADKGFQTIKSLNTFLTLVVVGIIVLLCVALVLRRNSARRTRGS